MSAWTLVFCAWMKELDRIVSNNIKTTFQVEGAWARVRLNIVKFSDEDERRRLQELYALDIVDTPGEPAFDRITRLVADVFQVPTCLITLVTEDRQWFKSCFGLQEELERSRSTEREAAICQYVVAEREPVVVTDARLDERFADNRFVRQENGIRFYAGVPIQTSKGNILGSLCIIDTEPRTIGERELARLVEFGRWVVTEIELRRDLREKELLAERLQQVIAKSESQAVLIRQAFESGLEGRLLCDGSGRIVLHNEKLVEWFRVQPAHYPDVRAFAGHLLQSGEARSPQLLERLEQLLNGHVELFAERLDYRLKDGERRVYEVTGYVIGLTETSPQHYYIGIRDRTDEEKIDRMKSEFMSVVSHELRTPLTSIMGFAEIIKERNPEADKRHSYLQTIHREAKRLTLLLNDLLDLQRMEAGQQSYSFSPTDMRSLAAEAVEGWKEHATHRILLQAGPNPLLVYADPERMKQALVHLISNAVKYSPESDRVEVKLMEEDGRIHVTVRDYGLGIPERAREKLFTKFYRVDNSDRRKMGGTGLGLAVVKQIVTAHGGSIHYVSEVGQGSSFTLAMEKYAIPSP